MPGVLSARWSGKHGDDLANLRLVLGQLTDVPDERRGAHFACAAALVLPSGRQHVSEGTVHGRVTRLPRGEHGPLRGPFLYRPGGTALLSGGCSLGRAVPALGAQAPQDAPASVLLKACVQPADLGQDLVRREGLYARLAAAAAFGICAWIMMPTLLGWVGVDAGGGRMRVPSGALDESRSGSRS